MEAQELRDGFDRQFVYLRLSVTDRCNFRCVYCLPNGYERNSGDQAEDLSVEEVRRLVSGFAALGVSKVRLTGGEPTVRRDIVDLAHAVSHVPGISRVAITTNGYRLASLAKPLYEAGIQAVNISVDSLDPKKFSEITGTQKFEDVTRGVDMALQTGFQTVKINSVLLKDCNDDEIERFMEWVRLRPVSVRFIELMRTGKNQAFFDQRHVTAGTLRLRLLKAGWTAISRGRTDGPAVVYRHPHYEGSIGIIAPYAQDFCKTCNRLRVSARGALRLCLFGDEDVSLRQYLQSDDQQRELVMHIRAAVTRKPVSHFLNEGKYGNTWNLAGIGG